jgi:hypothetical protein
MRRSLDHTETPGVANLAGLIFIEAAPPSPFIRAGALKKEFSARPTDPGVLKVQHINRLEIKVKEFWINIQRPCVYKG